jgi:hypothetical protein
MDDPAIVNNFDCVISEFSIALRSWNEGKVSRSGSQEGLAPNMRGSESDTADVGLLCKELSDYCHRGVRERPAPTRCAVRHRERRASLGSIGQVRDSGDVARIPCAMGSSENPCCASR